MSLTDAKPTITNLIAGTIVRMRIIIAFALISIPESENQKPCLQDGRLVKIRFISGNHFFTSEVSD